MSTPVFVRDLPPAPPAAEFLRTLTQRGEPYAVIRHGLDPDRPPSTTVLVDPASRNWITSGLRGSSVDGSPSAHVISGLYYGRRVRWLATSEPPSRIIRRAVEIDGVRTASVPDRFVDVILHCLLDLRAFPSRRRAEARELMAQMRSDPPAAGRAAERVQFELAPALTWGELLAHVVRDEWDPLLRRSRRLGLRLWRNEPLASTRRLLTRHGPGVSP